MGGSAVENIMHQRRSRNKEQTAELINYAFCEHEVLFRYGSD